MSCPRRVAAHLHQAGRPTAPAGRRTRPSERPRLRQLPVRSDPRRHEGCTGARTLGVPCADRLLERTARDGQEPDGRRGTGAPSVGHLRSTRQAGSPSSSYSSWSGAGGSRIAAGSRSRCRRSASCSATRYTPASWTRPSTACAASAATSSHWSPKTCSTACRQSSPAARCLLRPSSGRIPTSRCVRSSAASPADVASRAAGRRVAASTTPTTTAALAAAP